MSRPRHKFTRMSVLALSLMTILSLLAACGAGAGGTQGAATTGAEAPAGAAATAGGATAAPELAAAPPPTPVPTPLPEAKCTPEQKQLVWMVRSGEPENSWEVNVVRPGFQKAHPEICLKILSIRQDDIAVKREAMIASGEPLHVWSSNWGGDGFASDRARGLLADLTPLIQRDKFDTSGFIPSVLKIYQSEGKTWGLPFLTTGTYVYYNQKLFKEANVPFPPVDWDDKSWTWDKFIETAKKLTKDTNDINKAQFGAGGGAPNLEGPPMIFGHQIWPADAFETGFADKINVTNEKSIRAYNAFHAMTHKDKVAPDQASATALSQLGGAFASGRLAMEMSGGWGHWAWKKLIDDPQGFCWGVAPLPWGSPDANERAVIFTDPWVITRNLKPEDEDAAWKFIKFLVSPEQAALYTKTTGTPPTQSALLDDYYKQFSKCMKPEDMKKVFEGAFTHGRESSNHMMVRWDELNQIWGNNLSTFWTDPNAKAENILPQVEQQTNEALARIKAEKGQ